MRRGPTWEEATLERLNRAEEQKRKAGETLAALARTIADLEEALDVASIERPEVEAKP